MAALRTAPLHLPTLFPDSVIKQVEEDITSYDKGQSRSVYKKGRYHPYERPESKSDNRKAREAGLEEPLTWTQQTQQRQASVFIMICQGPVAL